MTRNLVKIALQLLFAICVTLQANAQDGRATGKVVDDIGEGLPDVAVTIIGTTKGTTTNADGEYILSGLKKGDKIRFFYVGMKEVIIEFTNNGKPINVTLLEDAQALEEVTVVAFGKQKKASIVSSIETVSTKELTIPSSNLTQAFSGRIAGMIAYQTSGEPGRDNAEFFIRGITTFGSGFYPLILIDNIEVSSDDLAKMHPDDIEAFSVLKDATATALYGARGANGVILVTTKSGQEGKPKISVRVENTFSSNTTNIKLADPITYMNMHNEATSTRSELATLTYPKAYILDVQSQRNPIVFPNTDWVDVLCKDWTTSQRANINFTGGGSSSKYYVAASVSKDNGIFTVDKRNNFNNELVYLKYLLHSNVNINLTKTTEMVVRLHGAFDQYQGPLSEGSGLYKQVMYVSPVRFPPTYPNVGEYEHVNHILFGNSEGTGKYMNPYAELLKGYKQTSSSMMMAQVEFNQNFNWLLEGLTGRALFNTKRNASFYSSRQYVPFWYEVDEYDRPTNTYTIKALNYEGSGVGTEYLSYSPGSNSVNELLYGEVSLNYGHKFGLDHTISAMLVGTMRQYQAANSGSLQSSLPQRNQGMSGRFTYSYLDKYFVEYNFGYNGSEKFAPKHRWGYFPSYGLGWIVSNEAFWEKLKKIVSLLKFRGTYGLVGNDAIGSSRFFYMWEVNPRGGASWVAGSNLNGWGSGRRGYSIINYENPYITWEIAYKSNLGIEIELFNKLNVNLDIYKEHRVNILQARADIPTEMGLWAAQYMNVGEAAGNGVDIAADYNHSITKDWWAVGRFNFTFAKSKYLYYEEPDYEAAGTPWLSVIGNKINQARGYVAERLFTEDIETDITAGKYTVNQTGFGGTLKGGDILYKDINGDKLITSLDVVPMGYPTVPEINYGFGISSGYKNVDFSVFFQGSGRSSFFISYSGMAPFGKSGGTETALAQFIVDDHWSEENQNPYAKWPRLSIGALPNNAVASTYWLRDNYYLRFKTFEAGYTVPEKVCQKYLIKNFRFYISGSNLLVWSMFDAWDPELGGNGLNYPLQRVFNAGINFSF
jgi:TonB-linked SusC/RagA family outer membrane protein